MTNVAIGFPTRLFPAEGPRPCEPKGVVMIADGFDCAATTKEGSAP